MGTVPIKETAEAGEAEQRAIKGAVRVAVAGATGFAGQELIRLLSRHPNVTCVCRRRCIPGAA
jgi:hypothetical protein